jgi:NAD+ synthase
MKKKTRRALKNKKTSAKTRKIIGIIRTVSEKRRFDAVKVKNDIVSWIKFFFEKNGRDCNAVIGISGGKDSSVVAALCAEALGKERVIGVKMPSGEQPDIECSNLLIRTLGIKSFEVNIKSAVDGLVNSLPKGMEISKQTFTNLPARIRMATLYAVSQSNHGRVANTCNLSENYVGYSTRYGDDAGDFSPLAFLTTEEVCAVGYELGLPKELIEKVPSDGLCGKTDEDNLGFTYKTLNQFIRTGICEDVNVRNTIAWMNRKNRFKLSRMPEFKYGAPIFTLDSIKKI